MSIKLPEWMDQYYRVLSDYEVEDYELPENPSFCEMTGGDDFYHIAYVMAYEEWEEPLMDQNLGVLEYGTWKGVKGIYTDKFDQIVEVTEDDVDAVVDEAMDIQYDTDESDVEGEVKDIVVMKLDPNKLDLTEEGESIIESFNNSDNILLISPFEDIDFYDYQELIEILDNDIFDEGQYMYKSDDEALVDVLNEATDMAQPYPLTAHDIDYIKVYEDSEEKIIDKYELIELGKKYSRYPDENY